MFPEPVRIITTVEMGDSVKLVGEGLTTGRVHQPILTNEQIASLEISPEKQPFDGDSAKFRLGIEALRLGLAYEYDPYFSLSIARGRSPASPARSRLRLFPKAAAHSFPARR